MHGLTIGAVLVFLKFKAAGKTGIQPLQQPPVGRILKLREVSDNILKPGNLAAGRIGTYLCRHAGIESISAFHLLS